MKRAFTLLALISISSLGCSHVRNVTPSSCQSCGPNARHAQRQADHVPRMPRGSAQQMGSAGPSSASVAYPYYTNRAPRDFLMANPPSIGY